MRSQLTIINRFLHHHSKPIFPVNFTKINGYPSCNDCIHFIQPNPNDLFSTKCRKFLKKNFITNENEYISVDISRSHYELCGPEAKYKNVADYDGKFGGP
jgi:hypothetical protein